jgi:hypothetical protein
MSLKINSVCLYKVGMAVGGAADTYSNQTKHKTVLVHNMKQRPGWASKSMKR